MTVLNLDPLSNRDPGDVTATVQHALSALEGALELRFDRLMFSRHSVFALGEDKSGGLPRARRALREVVPRRASLLEAMSNDFAIVNLLRFRRKAPLRAFAPPRLVSCN